MTAYVRDGGVWKQVKTIYVRDGGVWKTVKAGFVRDGGAWKQFTAPPAPPLFTASIAGDAANVNLRGFANAAGYGGAGDCTITLNAEVFSGTTGAPALVPGAWPAGITLTLIVAAGRAISGAGGAGGPGAGQFTSTPALAGGAGGTALDASGVAGFTFKVQNLGTISGGGGGGGGGAYNPAVRGSDGEGNPIEFAPDASGSGGGGGQGRVGGAGGDTDPTAGLPGTNGTAGSPSSSGTGGPQNVQISGFAAGGGGNGGGFGAAGSPGQASTIGNPGGAAGAAGYAVTGNANIVWLAPGTRLGPIA